MKAKLISALIIVVAIVGWLVISKLSSLDDEFYELPEDTPDLSVEGARLYSYGADGMRLYDLNADTLKRYASRNELVIENANLLAQSNLRETWRLKANQAVLSDSVKRSESGDEAEKIALRGNISLELLNGSDRDFSLETEELEYYPFSKRVAGKHAVTITTNTSTVRAGSFEFNLDTDYMYLGGFGTQRVELTLSADSGI